MRRKSKIHFLFSDTPTVIAMAFISLILLLAVFAYPLSADSTPMANRMVVEIGAKSPGFRQQFLLVPKSVAHNERSWLASIFSGVPDKYDYIPVNSYFISGDQLYAVHYIDEGLQDTITYNAEAFHIEKQNLTELYIKENFIAEERYLLGTDRYGRDIWSRLLLGARVSLAVGVVSVLLSISIGLIMGALAGWYGGVVDQVVMYLVNILWSIPTLLLVFAVTLSIGKGFWEIFIAIGLTSWVGPARLIRGQVMQAKELDYVTAARALGYTDFRIILRHILPNIAGPVMVIASANFATAILVEAGLSFLGIGVQPPMPSWGLMIKEHYNFLITGKPIAALIPGIAIMLLVLAFNIIGNSLRDMLDVRK